MKIQLDIPKEINKELKIEKAKMDLKNLQEVILIAFNGRYNLK